ncbi:peptidase, partial [Escherichia coli]
MRRALGAGLLQGLRRLGWRDRREPGAINHVSLGSHCQT